MGGSRAERRHHQRRMTRRAFEVLGDWKEAAKRADYLSRCPQGCVYCANPRKILKGSNKARLTLAERSHLLDFRDQTREARSA